MSTLSQWLSRQREKEIPESSSKLRHGHFRHDSIQPRRLRMCLITVVFHRLRILKFFVANCCPILGQHFLNVSRLLECLNG